MEIQGEGAGEDAGVGQRVRPAGFLSSLQPGPSPSSLALLLLPVVFCPLLTPAQVQGLSHTPIRHLASILSYNSTVSLP